jgi:hypothetical protein
MALACVILFAPASAEVARSTFSDQRQYELFYAYKYQANFVERLLLECTADREVWRAFGFATAPLSNAYLDIVLGTSIFQQDPFTGDTLVARLWEEAALHFTRDPSRQDNPADPVLMAQRDVLHLVNLHQHDLDVLCDFAFWEEVSYLEEVIDDVLSDAEDRLLEDDFAAFMQRASDGLPLLRRLFHANPLSRLLK